MSKVVLLEDPQFGHQFTHVFGTCDHYFTVGEMAAAGGRGWEYAFVDFELADKYTGLGALIYLHEYSPQTKVVVFTSVGEDGRTLFALAARCWFDAWALLDKGLANDETLGMIKDGANPTTDVWTAKLARNGWMVNMLFQKPLWLQMWRLWPLYDGSVRALRKANPELRPASIRDFSEQAPDVVSAFQDQFFPTEVALSSRQNTARAVPLSAFGRTHSNFFNAPELTEVLDYAEPWKCRFTR